jgi:hypothetical protein
LAVSDLGVGLIVQPLSAVYKISEMSEDFQPYCVAGLGSEILAFTFTSTAFLTITAISVERYLAIHLHLRYKELVTVSRVVKVVISLWTLGFVLSGGRGFCYGSCQFMVLALATIFSLFLIITVICYIKIGQAVRRHTKQVYPASAHGVGGTLHDKLMRCVHMTHMKKSVVTMLYVVGTYVLCFVPYVIALTVCALLDWNPSSRGLLNVMFPIAFLNSSLNPVLYCWRIRNIRQLAKTTILKIFRISKA